MSNLTSRLENKLIPTIESMENEFDTHEFILMLAKNNQKDYIDALSNNIANKRPFQVLHSAIGKALKKISYRQNAPIQEVDANISSRNIFGEYSSCSKWKKMA